MRRVHVLAVEEGGREVYWAGDRWSPEREGAQEFPSYFDADQARTHLDTDRDVKVLTIVGARRTASA